ALWPPRRAGGVEDDRGVAAPPLGNLGVEKAGLIAGEVTAALLYSRVIVKIGLVVVAHAARVGKDDGFEEWAALLDGNQLVDLLLVFGDREPHLGVIEDEGHLLGDRILVDRHRHAAQGLRRGDRPIETRAVVANDRQLVAAAKPHR